VHGNVVRRHDYYPFGEEYAPPPLTPDRLRFTAKERDVETGLDYFGARYYASRIGRFTTVDPLMDQQKALVDPQQWNRYAYVRNNPLRYTDPDGRAIETLWDVANIAWSAKAVWDNPSSLSNWAALALDVGATVLPGVPAVGGTLRVVGRIDDVVDGTKAVRALPAISSTTIETALATGAEAAGRQGTAAFRALASHIDRGDPAFQGVAKTAESALGLIRSILGDPARVAAGQNTVDIYNAAGQGIRLEVGTGKFIGFLDGSRATR
jgi:RHS repeat-associated protein